MVIHDRHLRRARSLRNILYNKCPEQTVQGKPYSRVARKAPFFLSFLKSRCQGIPCAVRKALEHLKYSRAVFFVVQNMHKAICEICHFVFLIFFPPDYTVGFGIPPNHALRLAGCTAGRESHPAPKILFRISFPDSR